MEKNSMIMLMVAFIIIALLVGLIIGLTYEGVFIRTQWTSETLWDKIGDDCGNIKDKDNCNLLSYNYEGELTCACIDLFDISSCEHGYEDRCKFEIVNIKTTNQHYIDLRKDVW